MKNNILTILIVLLIFSSGCESDEKYEALNIDPKLPTVIDAEPIFAAAIKSLFDEMVNTYDGFSTNYTGVFNLLSRYYTQTQYINESNYDFSERQTESVFWQRMYQILYNLKKAKEIVISDERLSDGEKESRSAQITILEVYTWQTLVDTFGNIPYTEALDPENILLPKYDDAESIYLKIIGNLDAALSTINNGTGFSESDFIYKGNLSLWKKLGNSLKLKLGIRLADVDLDTSRKLCEEAYKAGLFSNSTDNMNFEYLSSPPNTNPLWSILIQTKRNDYVVSDIFVETIVNLDDPRKEIYFKDNILPYNGGVYGDINLFESYTSIGSKFEEPNLEGVLLSYSEVLFYLAEAAERKFTVGNTATKYYNLAIKASMDYWNIPSTVSNNYLANPVVVYDSSIWKKQLGTQFWLSMYNRGFEGWNAYRKYDFNQFLPAKKSDEDVPTRFKYPQSEQNINSVNLQSASEAIGGDAKSTKLFWDKY